MAAAAAAYEPSQALREEIARLGSGRPQGARAFPSAIQYLGMRDMARFTATIHIKQEPVSHQIKHESSDVKSAPSFGGSYDAQRTTAGTVGEYRGELVPLPLTSWTQDAQSLLVKHEPRDVQSVASASEPSQALQYEWSRYQSQRQRAGESASGSPPPPHPSAAAIKQEPYTLPPTARPPTVAQSSRTPESSDFSPTGRGYQGWS